WAVEPRTLSRARASRTSKRPPRTTRTAACTRARSPRWGTHFEPRNRAPRGPLSRPCDRDLRLLRRDDPSTAAGTGQLAVVLAAGHRRRRELPHREGEHHRAAVPRRARLSELRAARASARRRRALLVPRPEPRRRARQGRGRAGARGAVRRLRPAPLR